MKYVVLTIGTLDSRRHDIMMHVEDLRPQRHHHDEQQNHCAESLSVPESHSLGYFGAKVRHFLSIGQIFRAKIARWVLISANQSID